MNKTPTSCKKEMCVSLFSDDERGKKGSIGEGREVESCKFGPQTSQSIVSWTLGIRTR